MVVQSEGDFKCINNNTSPTTSAQTQQQQKQFTQFVSTKIGLESIGIANEFEEMTCHLKSAASLIQIQNNESKQMQTREK